MVSAYFMSLDPDVRAAQFDEYAKCEAIEVFRLAERMGWREVVANAPSEFHDSDWIRSVEQQFPARVQEWMQVGMDKAIAAIEECWKTDKGKRQLRETADLLHISGDRHSHVGAIDTVRKLSSTDGQLTLRLGPGREWYRPRYYSPPGFMVKFSISGPNTSNSPTLNRGGVAGTCSWRDADP